MEKNALDFRENFLRAFYIACRTQADVDAVFALGVGCEVVVEADDAGNLRFRENQLVRHVLLHFAGEITEDVLSLVQNLDEVSTPAIVFGVNAKTIDEGVQFGKFCLRAF